MSEEPGASSGTPDSPPETPPETPTGTLPEAPAGTPPEAPTEAPAGVAAAAPTTAIPTPVAPAAAAGATGTPPPTTPVAGTTGGTSGGRNALIIGAVIVAAAIIVGALLVSQGGGASPSPSPSASAAPSAAPTEPATAEPTATVAPTAAPTATPNACAPENLPTLTAGTLTIGTDNPAYSPYWLPREGGNTPPWDTEFSGDPTTGTGFESAVAYAVADHLGFTKDQVAWVAVAFDNSYAPGPKPFDFYLAQVSYKPERAQTADLSDGYYWLNQSLVAIGGTPIASATTIAELKGFQFGAQAGTTSYDTIVNVIQPDKEPKVYSSNDAAIQALTNKQIDGLVVDLPTAFYITAAQMDNGTIVGQFAPTGAEKEHFSMVLAKGSPLTACVNQALAAMTEDGTLAKITQEWMADKANAPVITP
jgi:polar amino acid transport system substrate-binding protein